MRILAGIWVALFTSVNAAPLLVSRHDPDVHDDGSHNAGGVPPTIRTIFAVLSLICMSLLSFLMGTRYGRLKRSVFMKRNFISMLVLIIYILVLAFILTAAVLVSGQGLTTYTICRAGVRACLFLYTFTKAAILLFLVERIHVVRAPFFNRRQDKIYLACLATVILTFGPVIVHSYLNPVTSMDPSNGRCYFGISGRASIPILAVSTFVDIVLTGVFFYLLRPKLAPTTPPTNLYSIKSLCTGKVPLAPITLSRTTVQRDLRTLLWRSLIGSLLIEIPMMANMIQFVVTKGEELGTVCMALCVIELVWNALVIHWLAFNKSMSPGQDVRSRPSSSRTQFTRTQSSSRAAKSRDGHVGVEDDASFPWVTAPEMVRVKWGEDTLKKHARSKPVVLEPPRSAYSVVKMS